MAGAVSAGQGLTTAAFARTLGRVDAVHLALFRAFFEDRRDIGDMDVLLDVGRGAGLPLVDE